MTYDALFWLGMTLFFTLLMSFYSTQEMATISTNTLRLEHAKNEGATWAGYVIALKSNPTLLFVTTLIGVNLTLMIGSECARRFFSALDLPPSTSLFIYAPFVLLFGELIPMFAARLHATHMCRLGSPFLYWSAKVVAPCASLIDYFFRLLQRCFGVKTTKDSTQFLSKEELQKLLEEHEIGLIPEGSKEFSTMIDNILSLRTKTASQLMTVLSKTALISSNTSLAVAKRAFCKHEAPFALVFAHDATKIIGAVDARDFISSSSSLQLQECSHPITFTNEAKSALELFLTMEEEKNSVAVVLNKQGIPIGTLSIHDLYDELFSFERLHPTPKAFLEKNLPADTPIIDFNSTVQSPLTEHGCTTLGELIAFHLGRAPQKGDTLFIDPFEITVTETSLFKAKTLHIETKM